MKLSEVMPIGEEEAAVPAQPVVEKKTGQSLKLSDVMPKSDAVIPAYKKKEPEGVRGKFIFNEVKSGLASFFTLPSLVVDAAIWGVENFPNTVVSKDTKRNIATVFGKEPSKEDGITPFKPRLAELTKKGLDTLMFTERLKPQNTAERYAGKVAEYAGASIFPARAIIAKAVSKTAPIIIETTSIVTGGLGAEFGRSHAEDFGLTPGQGEAIGGIVAGLAPNLSQGVASSIYSTGKSLYGREGGYKTFVRNRAKAHINAAMEGHPNVEANLKRAEELNKRIEGFNPDLSRASGAEGMIALQSKIESKAPAAVNKATVHYDAAMAAIEKHKAGAFPLTVKDPTKHVDTLVRRTVRNLQKQSDDLLRQEETLAKQFSRKPTAAIGAESRKIRAARMTIAQREKNLKYEQLYQEADNLNITESVDDLVVLVNRVDAQDQSIFQSLPGTYAKIKSVTQAAAKQETGQSISSLLQKGVGQADGSATVNFRWLHSLWRDLNKEYAGAVRQLDPQKKYFLDQMREAVAGKISKYDSEVYGTFAAHKKAVDQWWLKEYHSVYRQGVGAEMAAQDRYGALRTPDEKIISDLVMKPGTARGLTQYRKLFTGDPRADELLVDGVMDVVTRRVIRKGVVDKTGLETFKREYKEVLDQMPEMNRLLDDADGLIDVIAQRKAVLHNKLSLFRKSKIAKLSDIKGLDARIEAGLKDPAYMRIIINQTPASGRQELASHIADLIVKKPNPRAFLTEHQAVLQKELNKLGKNHYQNLTDIVDSMEIMTRLHKPTSVPYSTKPVDRIKEAVGTGVDTLTNQVRWVIGRKIAPEWLAINTTSKAYWHITQKQAEKILEEAVYNPDFAETLKMIATKEEIPELVFANFRGHILNMGLRTTAVVNTTPPEFGEDDQAQGQMTDTPIVERQGTRSQ